MRDVDVVIIGAGQAGVFLARQLRRALPSASILLAEKATERSWKVGESTVDICGKYMTKRLGLSTYLYEHQLTKNGLRFFFDREDRQAPLESLTEVGSTGLLPFPAFQLDRARLERDLLAMNARAGVEVREGTRVEVVTLGAGGAPHVVALEDGARREEVRARWLVDASGRASVLARRLDLRVELDHPIAAAWGRLRGVLDLDDWGSSAFRERVRSTARSLSTNHFCYPGYWIWFIPLREGVVSVGYCIERERWRDEMRKPEGFLGFLREHRAVAEQLEGAELLDVLSFGKLAYGTKRLFSGTDRWALIGEAAAFADPLYSPGGDFIALENDYATDLVAHDLSGEGPAALEARARTWERFVLHRFDAAMQLYLGLYGTLGSYRLFTTKWSFDLASYLNLWVEPYFLDLHLDLGFVQRELENAPLVLGALKTFGAMFRKVEQVLRADGRYYDGNVGETLLDPANRLLVPGFGTMASREAAPRRLRDAYQHVFDLAHGLVHPGKPRPSDEPLPFSRFVSGLPLL